MYILHIATELASIAKTGGLGDVTYGLCKELQRQGHQVQVIMPKYDTIDYNKIRDLRVYYRDLWSYDGSERYHNTVWAAETDSLSLLLLEPHHPNYLFSRGTVYGCADDLHRFLYFSRAVTEFLFKSGLRPDILHLHDWPTAIIPVLQKDMYQTLGFAPIKTVLTLHNLEHQGKCFVHELSSTGLNGDAYLQPNSLQDPSDPHLINLLKGGILYADAITTVSPSYKKEILTQKEGFGLQNSLLENEKKLHGILNGIDEDFWNPEIDPHLPNSFPAHPPFSNTIWKQIQEGKALNKAQLRKRLGLEESNVPLVCCIGRIVEQKAPHLIIEAFKYILSKKGQCIILGSPYGDELNRIFHELQYTYKDNPNGMIILEYDEPLSHLLYAASDMLLMPSLFEPCGLSQMIALRYGCIPIVRKTGGLADTITTKNGFIFESPTTKELFATIDEALCLWNNHKDKWLKQMEQGLSQDFSWKSAAKEYLAVYANSLKMVSER